MHSFPSASPSSAPSEHARRPRDDRGVVLPSSVLALSIVALLVAGLSFVLTRDGESTEQAVAPVARNAAGADTTGRSGTDKTAGKGHSSSAKPAPTKKAKPKPKPVQRDQTYVAVFNNSGITGLAGQVAAQTTDAGWQVVGTDNWYGSIPSSTVYYPDKMKRAARSLARDLGITRTMPAVDPMSADRLTVILTAPLT